MIRASRLALVVGLLFLAGPAAAQEGTWQQNYDLGKRHFALGRYVEADQFMTRALAQAEGFGGKDARLYQSLNQLSLKFGAY